MNRLLTILLLLGATAHGQINNPPTSVNIVDSTATGRAVLTATNAAAAATAVGLGTTNAPIFSNIQLSVFGFGSSGGFAGRNSGGLFELYGTNLTTSEPAFYGFSGFVNTAFSAGEARTNLGLGATNDVTFSNITASGTLAVTGNVTLSGVNNTATAQTADSASSLMTRELTDNNPLWALGSVRPMGAYSFGSSGSPATAIEAVTRGGAFVNTGTNTNGYGRASLYQGINDSSSMTGQGIRFNQSISVSAVLTFLVRSNSVIRLIVGGNGGVPASGDSDAIATRGFGLEVANDAGSFKFRLFAHNGTTYTNSAYTAALPVGFTNQSHIIIRNQTNGLVSLFCANSALNKAPSRPSTTPLLTLSNGPTSGSGGAFVDLVAVTLTNTAVASGGQAVFYNGMVEVKD